MWKKLLGIRNWPHPEYGNYLGANRRCDSKKYCPLPVDAIDSVGWYHDADMNLDNKPHADLLFAWRMSKINPFTTTYAEPAYGRVYQYGSAIVMGLIGLISTPIRLFRRSV